MYFHYFVITSPWKRAGPFIWTNLNPLHPRMLCAKFGWNWLSGSGEEDENVRSLRRQRQQRQQQQRLQRRQRRTTDKFWSEKLTWAFGSGELKTFDLNIFFYRFQHWKIMLGGHTEDKFRIIKLWIMGTFPCEWKFLKRDTKTNN